MPENLIGWELMYRITRPSMKQKRDLITTFIHWSMLKKNITCLGVGEKKHLSDNEVGSELLPADWNKDDKYMLRYKHGNDLYILYGIESSGTALFNFLKTSDNNVYNLAVNIDSTVLSLDGTIEEMIPDYENLMQKIKTNILHTIIDKMMIDVGTQTQEVKDLSVNNRGQSLRRPNVPDIDFDHDPLRGIGSGDLFPGHGGMIFDPRGRGPRPDFFMPRGPRLPGSRFDPYAPPGFGYNSTNSEFFS